MQAKVREGIKVLLSTDSYTPDRSERARLCSLIQSCLNDLSISYDLIIVDKTPLSPGRKVRYDYSIHLESNYFPKLRSLASRNIDILTDDHAKGLSFYSYSLKRLKSYLILDLCNYRKRLLLTHNVFKLGLFALNDGSFYTKRNLDEEQLKFIVFNNELTKKEASNLNSWLKKICLYQNKNVKLYHFNSFIYEENDFFKSEDLSHYPSQKLGEVLEKVHFNILLNDQSYKSLQMCSYRGLISVRFNHLFPSIPESLSWSHIDLLNSFNKVENSFEITSKDLFDYVNNNRSIDYLKIILQGLLRRST